MSKRTYIWLTVRPVQRAVGGAAAALVELRTDGYSVGVARSVSGELWGPWAHDPEPLFAGDGGHCMLFRSKEGKLMMALHAPNAKGRERPTFIELAETDNGLSLGATAQGSKGV